MKYLLIKLMVIHMAITGIIAQASAQELPNIVFYIADDMSQADASIYGAKTIRTPTMEKLASMGLTFDNAFVASPSCAPSRAALLTGLMPARNGAEPNHYYPKEGIPMLTKPLQEIGYEIVAFGKVAHYNGAERVGFDYHSDNQVNLAARVTEYLNQRKSKKPLCLMVGDRRPHVPWTKDNIYNPDELELPSYFIDTKETRQHWSRYYSDITGLDDEMGQVFDLAQQKFGKDFLFLFTSDHGGQWPFGKWNLYDVSIKSPLIVVWPGKIEKNTRTTAMVSWIDIFPTLIDITGARIPINLDGRSFYEVIKDPSKAHREIVFTTHSGDNKWNVYPIRSVRNKRYKYISNLLSECYHTNHSDILRKDGAGAYWDSWDAKAATDLKAKAIISKYYVRPAEEFYDLKNDPLEQKNLIDKAELCSEIEKMRLQLDEWMTKHVDQKTVFNEPYHLYEDRPTKLILMNKE